MYNNLLEKEVHTLFVKISTMADEITDTSRTKEQAMSRIAEKVASEVSMECEGYIIDLYGKKVDILKNSEYFQNPDNLNAFYRLNLRNKLNERFKFEINSLEAYKKGIEYKEVNALYMTAATAAGTVALGGILKYALNSTLGIPFAVIIAGAVITSCLTYFIIAQDKNKKNFKRAVGSYLFDMEQEILNWLNEISLYFDEQVRELQKS